MSGSIYNKREGTTRIMESFNCVSFFISLVFLLSTWRTRRERPLTIAEVTWSTRKRILPPPPRSQWRKKLEQELRKQNKKKVEAHRKSNWRGRPITNIRRTTTRSFMAFVSPPLSTLMATGHARFTLPLLPAKTLPFSFRLRSQHFSNPIPRLLLPITRLLKGNNNDRIEQSHSDALIHDRWSPDSFCFFLLLSETVVLTRGTRTAESSCAMSLVVTWQEAKERESGNEASDFYFQVIFYLQRLPFVLQQGTSKPQTKKVVISFITIMTRYVQNTLARTHARKRRRVFFNGIENDNRRRFTHSRLIYGREALTSRHTTRFDCFTWDSYSPLYRPAIEIIRWTQQPSRYNVTSFSHLRRKTKGEKKKTGGCYRFELMMSDCRGEHTMWQQQVSFPQFWNEKKKKNVHDEQIQNDDNNSSTKNNPADVGECGKCRPHSRTGPTRASFALWIFVLGFFFFSFFLNDVEKNK